MDNGDGRSPEFLANLALGFNNNEEDNHHTSASLLDRLVQGDQVMLRLNPKSMLVYIMGCLGSMMEPVFTEVACGNNYVKMSIKLDVATLNSPSQDRIMYSVVEGDTSSNAKVAETTAIAKAFTLLEVRYNLRISDFSSRMIVRYKTSGIYELVCEGLDLLQSLFSEWESTLQNAEDVAVKVSSNQFVGSFGEMLSDSGKLYALVGDDLCYNICQLKVTTDEARSTLNELHTGREKYENTWADQDGMNHTNFSLHEADFTSQDMLEFVMDHFGLLEPEFSNGPDDNGLVISSVVLRFPEMRKYRFSGNLKLSAKALTTIEAIEEVALEALAFVERNFPVTIVDFNYFKRKETLKQFTDLVGYMSRMINVATTVRTMWSNLDNVFECKGGLFRFDPFSIFPGGQSQREAYHLCANELDAVKQYSSDRFAYCADRIEAIDKLAWKLFVLKNNFGM